MKQDHISKKNKLFLLFILELVFVFPFLMPHFSLDSYTLLSGSYVDSSIVFLKSGRLVTFAFYNFFDLIHLPFTTLSVISTLLSIVFSTLTTIKTYNLIGRYLKVNSIVSESILLITSLLLYLNFANMEIFVFIESFIIFIGIYFIIFSIEKLIDKKYAISFLFLLFSILCYQGIICIFLPILLFILFLKNNVDSTEKFKNVFINFLIGCIYYCLALLFSYIFIKIICFLFINCDSSKILNINIFKNIVIASGLAKNSLLYLYSLFSTKLFYGMILILILVYAYVLIKEKQFKKFFYPLFITLMCLVLPFIPNIVVNSDINYTAARMAGSMGLIIPILVLFVFSNKNVLKSDKIEYKRIYILLIFVLGILYLYTNFQYYRNMTACIRTYNNDYNYIKSYLHDFDEYEYKNNVNIEKIYIIKSSTMEYHYLKENVINGFSYKVASIDWAFPSLFKFVYDRSVKIEYINQDSDEFNIKLNDFYTKDKNVIFEKNVAYIYIY